MAEDLILSQGDKQERYETLYPQIQALVTGETDEVANMANVAAALWETFGFFWVGFYRVIGGQLVLGPFQGPVACTRIRKGKGVCGTAWATGQTVVVPDVEQFPGHIAVRGRVPRSSFRSSGRKRSWPCWTSTVSSSPPSTRLTPTIWSKSSSSSFSLLQRLRHLIRTRGASSMAVNTLHATNGLFDGHSFQ